MSIQCDQVTTCCPPTLRTEEILTGPEEATTEAKPDPAPARDGVEAAPVSVNFEPTTIVGHALRPTSSWQAAPSLAAVASGHRKLGRGHRGPEVAHVQRQLQALGYDVAEDGKLGPRTQAALVSLQRAHGLTAERGRVGPGTLAVLEARHAALAKAGMDAAASPQFVLRDGSAPTAPIMRLPSSTRSQVRALAENHVTTDADRRKLYELLSSADFSTAPAPVQARVLHRVEVADDKSAALDAALSLADQRAFVGFDAILRAIDESIPGPRRSPDPV